MDYEQTPQLSLRSTMGLLVLTLIARAADGVCPLDASTLSLKLPEVVVQHGDPLDVNCSMLLRNVPDKSWVSTDNNTHLVPNNVTSVEWDTEAYCTIKLNESLQCNQLSIIVYKTPDSVSISPLNHSGPMVEGNQYQLQCNIQNVAPLQNLVVKWYKGNESIENKTYTNSSNKKPVTESLILTINPSREDDGAQFTCEAELHLGPGGPQTPPTVTSKHQIHVVPSQQQPPMFSTAYPTPGTMTTVQSTVKPKGHRSLLELDPPRAVVRYGDSVSVNCSTSATDPEGMGWEATIGGVGFEEFVTSIIWTVAKLTDWTVETKCYVTLSNGTQPKEVLPVIVYKTPDSVSISPLNHSGPMVEGKEYQLQCNIQNVAPLQNLVVKWYKGNDFIANKTYKDPNKKKPVNKSPTLNITANREDNGTQFRCEAELHLGPEGPQTPPTVTSETLYITVHYGPDIDCSGVKTLDILEGQNLVGHCSVEGNPSPVTRWLKAGKSFEPSTLLSRTDAGPYTITANGLVNISHTVWVNVVYGPEFNCPMVYNITEHEIHNLSCMAEGYPVPDVMWIKDGEMVDFPEKLTNMDAGQYRLYANSSHSTVNHTLDIHVLFKPRDIQELLDTKVDTGSSTQLKCSSSGNPAPEYSWIYHRTPNVRVETKDGVSLLKIVHATGENIGTYTCYVRNTLGNVSKTAMVFVIGAEPVCPIKLSNERVVIKYEDQVSVSCSNTTSAEWITWTIDGVFINDTTWSVESLLQWDIRPNCTANFQGIGTCSKPLHITVYKTPDSVSISPLNHSGPMVEGNQYQLQCKIQNVAPLQNLVVKWYKGNVSIDTKTYRDSSKKKPVNKSLTLTINPSREDDGAQFRCEAELHLGPGGPQTPPTVTSELMNIIVHYAPKFLPDNVKAVLVSAGSNASLVCSAEGNPSPVLNWNYTSADNVILFTVGKQKTVLITRATSANAGIYICTANNSLGLVTRETTVTITDTGSFADHLITILLILLIIFLIFVVIFYLKWKKKHGNYNFTPIPTALPMTEKCNGEGR
ncbi:hypothetical protein UPYG_G00100800 [Umbra pygmaea]|uniref:Ig-like domain-containing protein n=1 Tax=Umbra pygmaea TaxID=75934 RepID=A0ABD0XL26_UMBPY